MTADSTSDELEVQEELDDEEAFVTYEIASYPSDLTLSGIVDMWNAGDIEIPDFQRNYVWTIQQASSLIESFLLGLPVPQVFFYVGKDNKSLLIDGQQRILSTVYFFEGFFGRETAHGRRQVFRLTGLNEKSPYAGKRYPDLDDASQRRLRGSVLRAINIRQLSPKEENTSIYHIFERLNTGGTPLTPQEIRNCVFHGDFVKKLRTLNRTPSWRKILGNKVEDRHQKDVELILRVFALSNRRWEKYEKPMKEFLNVAMRTYRDGSSPLVARFMTRFEIVCEAVSQVLGEKPFHIRGPLNSSVLDSVMCTLIDHPGVVPDNLKSRFAKLVADDAFKESTYYGTSDVSVLQRRFDTAKAYLIP